jgi:hypothetical protein
VSRIVSFNGGKDSVSLNHFVREENMGLPNYITHYFKADYGPFLNICDLSDAEADHLVLAERGAQTAFNRFAMGSGFLQWRREADDLLIRS